MNRIFEAQFKLLKSTDERLVALLDYIEANHRKNPEGMAVYCEVLLQELAFTESAIHKVKAYILCGQTSWFLSDLKSALGLYLKALETATAMEDRYYVVKSLTGLGNVYADRDEYDESLKYYFEALKIAEEDNNTEYIVALYNNLGEIYKHFKSYDKALEHYQLAIHFMDQATMDKNLHIYSIVRQNIGEIYNATNQYDAARSILLECIDLFIANQNLISLSSTYHNIAELEMKVQDYPLAMSYYEKSHALFEQIHDRVNHIPMLVSYSHALNAIGRRDEAETYFILALDYAKQLDQPYLLTLVTSALAHFYENNAKYEEALKLYKDYHDSDKRSERIKTNQRLDSVTARFESEENQRRSEHYRTTSNVYKERTEELERAYERMTLISNIGKRLTSTQDLSLIYEYMYESLSRIMAVDAFVMSVFDEPSQKLMIQLLIEDRQRIDIDSVDVNSKTSLLVWCFKHNKDVFSGNILTDFGNFIEDTGSYAGDPLMQSVICVPIQFQSSAIGVFSVQSKKQHAFDMYQLEFLKALSAYIAIAINNAMKSKALTDEIEFGRKTQAKLEELNNKLKDLSERDGLTGVANRHRLESYLSELALADHSKVCIYMVDIDYFKNYNDSYGHLKGDEVLIEVAQTLETIFKSAGGFLARYGGEEFVGITIGLDLEEATAFGEGLLSQIRSLCIPHRETELGILSISIGIASNSKLRALEKTLNYADRALYLSKRTGRNKVSVHE